MVAFTTRRNAVVGGLLLPLLTLARSTGRAAQVAVLGIDASACQAVGIVPSRLQAVADYFGQMIDDARYPGAQLAIAKAGRVLAFFAAGHDADQKPVTGGSLVGMLSTSKLLATLVMANLHDRGVFRFDDRVAKHWPAFAQNGKADITIAQVMSHRAGLAPSLYGGYAQWKLWSDSAAVEKMIADMSPVWPPGSANGYHALTFGQIVEILVRRWTGRTTGANLRQTYLAPLHLRDVYLGLPPTDYPRFAKFFPPPSGEDRPAFAPPPGGEGSFFNSEQMLELSLPWGSGVANAHDLALLLQVYAHKGALGSHRFFSPATFDFIATPTNDPQDVDRILKRHVRWGTGLMVDGSEGVGIMPGPVFGAAAGALTVGHLGGNTALCWADASTHVSLAFMSVKAPAGPHYSDLSDVVRAACASR